MKEKCKDCPLLNQDRACWSVEEGHGIPCKKVDPTSDKFNPKYYKYIMEKSGMDTSLPSLLEEISNLAEATTNIVKDNFIKATQTEQTRRMDICKSCEMYEQGRCKSCGCFLDKKVIWRVSFCPLEKWGEEIQVGREPVQINPNTSNDVYDCKCGK